MMDEEDFRKKAAELKGGESFTYYRGRLGDVRGSDDDPRYNRIADELGRTAWHYAEELKFGFLTQRKIVSPSTGEIFEYVFTRAMPKVRPTRHA